MKTKLKILFASDFSSSSKIALKTLNKLNQKYETDIHLIHVIESYWANWLNSGLSQKEAMQRLISWQKIYSKKIEIKKLHIKIGNSAEMILDTSYKVRSNLILLGGRNENSNRYKTGTTIENIVRSAKKTVWVCQRDRIKKIVCGVDGSPSSKKALQFALALAKKYKARLSIIHAMPGYLPAFGMSPQTVQREESKIKTESIKNIKKFLISFDLTQIKHEILFEWGLPANIILDHAEDDDSDLIVIGEKGHSDLYHVLLGTTAEKILRHAPCSLLVVR